MQLSQKLPLVLSRDKTPAIRENTNQLRDVSRINPGEIEMG